MEEEGIKQLVQQEQQLKRQQEQSQQSQQSQQSLSEEESLDEEDQNVFDESETTCANPNNEFCKSLLSFKHNLYSQTVLKPDTQHPDAQNIALLNPFLNLLEYFRGILIPILNGTNKRPSTTLPQAFLDKLPSESRQSAVHLHSHIVDTVRQNKTSNRELLESYTTFIHDMFHTFPFLMNNEFS